MGGTIIYTAWWLIVRCRASCSTRLCRRFAGWRSCSRWLQTIQDGSLYFQVWVITHLSALCSTSLVPRLFSTGTSLAALEFGSNISLLLFEKANEILRPVSCPVFLNDTLLNHSGGIIPIHARWEMRLNAHSCRTHRKRAQGPEGNRCVERATRVHMLTLLDEVVAIEERPDCVRREISLDGLPHELLAILNELVVTAGFHVSRQFKSERERPRIEDDMKAARPATSLTKDGNVFRDERNRRIAVRACSSPVGVPQRCSYPTVMHVSVYPVTAAMGAVEMCRSESFTSFDALENEKRIVSMSGPRNEHLVARSGNCLRDGISIPQIPPPLSHYTKVVAVEEGELMGALFGDRFRD